MLLKRCRSSIPLAALGVIGFCVTPAFAENDEDPFAPDTDHPEPESEDGPELGLRLGLTTGSGNFESGQSVKDFVTGMLPLWVDGGYRFYDRWFVGLYWQYALGLRSVTSEEACSSCVHSAIRYGLQVNYSVLRSNDAHVWVGLRFGHQSFESVDEETKRGTAYSGWEPVGVQFGSSWRPNLGVEIGPFFALGYSSMSSRQAVCYAPDRDACPPEDKQSVSGGPLWWNTFGIRAVFLP